MLPDASHVHIASRVAGDGAPLFVVAEIGLNHGGSLDRALASGAPAPVHVDAVSMVDFFQRFELDEAGYRRLADRARAHRLAFMATPLSLDAVAMLERVGTDAYKIASGDITWQRLIERCGATGKPVVISTGMATIADAERAMLWAVHAGASGVAILHCVSSYPVPKGSENLRAINTLAMACGAVVGLSDHGADTFAVPLAVAMGAAIYERHLVLAAGDGSVDADVSSTPDELAAVVRTAAHAAAALGTGIKNCAPAERGNLGPSRRGLYARHPLAAGQCVTDHDVVALRPAAGIGADRQAWLVGRRLARGVSAGMPIHEADVAALPRGAVHVA